MTARRAASAVLVTLGVFAVSLSWLDERRVACGALPVRTFTTDASSAAADSGLALDAAAETAWHSDDVEGAWWEASFPEPVVLRGLVVDLGNGVGEAAPLLPLGLRPGDRSRGNFEGLQHRRRFRIWHEFTWEPVAVAGVVLRPVPAGDRTGERCTLRDVRFLVNDPDQATAAVGAPPPLAASWRAAWLPLLLACAWTWWLASPSRARPVRA